MSRDDAVIIEAPEPATACVIWLHGLGADGHDFEPVVTQFDTLIRRKTRFVFPHASQQPVTINGGMVMRAWYDILDMTFGARTDLEGMVASETRVRNYIHEALAEGIATDRIVLAGFSQGGVIALRTGLVHEPPLGGIIALSTYLPGAESIGTRLIASKENLPVFLAHGTHDPLIPMEAAEQARHDLLGWGFDVQWHQYPMQHGVCSTEIHDINQWLLGLLFK